MVVFIPHNHPQLHFEIVVALIIPQKLLESVGAHANVTPNNLSFGSKSEGLIPGINTPGDGAHPPPTFATHAYFFSGEYREKRFRPFTFIRINKYTRRESCYMILII